MRSLSADAAVLLEGPDLGPARLHDIDDTIIAGDVENLGLVLAGIAPARST